MRNLVAALTLAAAVQTGNFAAEGPRPNPNPPVTPPQPAQVEKLERWEPTPDWLVAIERLRLNPKPGEVENGGITCGVTEVFALSKDETQNVDKILADYQADVLKKAAKWDEELKATRNEYEAKIIAALPEARRDAAKKVLELSHSKWVAPLEREQKFTKEFLEKEKAFKDTTKDKSPEEVNDARDEFKAWVKDERGRLVKEEVDLIAALKALLTPDEAQNLDKFNRHRTVAPPPTPSPPPGPVAPKTPPPKKGL